MNKCLLFFLFLFSYLFITKKVSAHAFGAMYTLPIPFWLYLFAGAVALLISFLIIGFFATSPLHENSFSTYSLKKNRFMKWLVSDGARTFYKVVSIGLFLLTIGTGLFGEDISAYNFNMTFFWVIFVLGFTYLTCIWGNVWQIVNPWRIITEIIENITRAPMTGTMKYPKQLGYFPAFLFYLIFICIELIVGSSPFSLSILLLQYTVITLFGVFLFGKETWFTYGEFFSVFFRFLSLGAVFTSEKSNVSVRLPFIGLLSEKARDLSTLLFILFMLSSTAFDGFRETNIWYSFYWENLSAFFSDSVGYQIVNVIGLIISPFIFLSLYLLTIWVMKRFLPTKLSVRELSYAFAFSLIPIAIVYNIAHYFTLLLLQGQEIFRLISDPFGWGWNLFGTANFSSNAGILSAATVWHTQVALILGGHIISVFLAHFIAIKLFPKQRYAVMSQIPMLVLMIVYTVIGLWILSQPIAVR